MASTVPSLAGFPYENAVAGAQLSTVSDGLGKALGVGSGVLVTSAPVSSPAGQSGLQDGDVITKVAGQAVRRVSDVRDLVALAADNGEHAIDVQVMRQRRTLKLTLKW
ncbi:MAG: PDZ domain-containing protein [Polaromonas sp.]|nr:PDZ domain-containing protein [Gemmatimonadaceae bacterium]